MGYTIEQLKKFAADADRAAGKQQRTAARYRATANRARAAYNRNPEKGGVAATFSDACHHANAAEVVARSALDLARVQRYRYLAALPETQPFIVAAACSLSAAE